MNVSQKNLSNRMSPENELRAAISERRLALFVGSGISVGSNLPTWDKLVAAIYFAGLSSTNRRYSKISRAYRNYLRAIADWGLERNAEPLQITASKAILALKNENLNFVNLLREVLYGSMVGPLGDPSPVNEVDDALNQNLTLMSICDLCENRDNKQISRVVTYNYDDLLERALSLRNIKHTSIWKSSQVEKSLPIFHVHGRISLSKKGPHSDENSLVFTEEQYHRSTYDPYSWSNLVQLSTISEFTGLCVGLSMSDPNMRRLLAAVSQTPRPPKLYALLVKSPKPKLLKRDLNKIHQGARIHLNKFTNGARMKIQSKELDQVNEIVSAVHARDHSIEDKSLRSFGVTPIWVDSVTDIPKKLAEIRG